MKSIVLNINAAVNLSDVGFIRGTDFGAMRLMNAQHLYMAVYLAGEKHVKVPRYNKSRAVHLTKFIFLTCNFLKYTTY